MKGLYRALGASYAALAVTCAGPLVRQLLHADESREGGKMMALIPAVRAPQPAKPTLVVFLTIDQMRGDYMQRWGSQFTGGLHRLDIAGAQFTQGYHDHAITETAPGHASTMSGRFPVHTG